MKGATSKVLLLSLIFAVAAMIFMPAPSFADPLNHRVDRLFAGPDGNSKVVYVVPLDIRLLDISDDFNWYKVQFRLNVGPAQLNIAGWAYIPVGDILIEREAKRKLASIASE
jgi:hypothetical protein